MTDEQFLTDLAAGDDDAWRQLLAEHGRTIYLAASRVKSPRFDRDDVFQDTCVAAYRAVSTLRDPSRMGAWLYRIAYRCALYRARNGSSILLATDLSLDTENIADPGPLVDELFLRLDSSERVRDGMAKLDERCRALLHALFLDTSLPAYEDIAESLGMPVGAVGPTRARCLKKLAKLIPATD